MQFIVRVTCGNRTNCKIKKKKQWFLPFSGVFFPIEFTRKPLKFNKYTNRNNRWKVKMIMCSHDQIQRFRHFFKLTAILGIIWRTNLAMDGHSLFSFHLFMVLVDMLDGGKNLRKRDGRMDGWTDGLFRGNLKLI